METRKMTKAQAQELVRNTKYIVFSEEESRALQEKLFEIGCKWACRLQVVRNTEQPFLFIDRNLIITYGDRKYYKEFEKPDRRYEHTDDILNIEIELEQKKQPKPKFDPRTLKPFDKVLVKNDGEVWNIDFYDRYESEAETYLCIGGLYTYCIPYNEETKYLHGNGNKEPEFYNLD